MFELTGKVADVTGGSRGIGAAAVSPVRSWAQRTTTIPRVGVLWHAGDAGGEWPYYGCLLEGFEELGYSQGKI